MNEKIEWTRMWREEADTSMKRVLLIGDSIIDGCKTIVGKSLPKEYTISSYATSKGVDDPFLFREVELMAAQENYEYAAVYFNSGLHFHEQSPEAYKENYLRTLKLLQEKIDAPFILGTSTPLTCGKGGDPAKHETPVTLRENNETVIAYNQKVREIADETGLPVFDAYDRMVGYPELKSDDGCHFNDEGKALLGKAIAHALEELL
ncbi:MAG: SGNH/GDSL hydrolase family protein [Clostridia bacterium]|nr:SGNH/GDSL hydrolase family protein [Clostridia bacterium]